MKKSDNSELRQILRDCSLPIFTVFLLLMCLLGGCSAPNFESIGSISLGSFGGGSQHTDCDMLTLVNPWNPIEEDYQPTLDSLSDGTQVDHRCIESLRALMTACREAGGAPYVCSGYRSLDTQSQLYENKVARVIAEGYERSEAELIAAREVAFPGTSEHQLGLAVDIIDSGYTALDEGQEDTFTQRWLMENSWRYGFILRYPEGKSEVTGIIYEPWHYRYVGEDAEKIYESGLCLEEWLEEK